MITPPTWALTASDAVRYFGLRGWQPRLVFDGRPEPLARRVERLTAAWSQSRASDPGRAVRFNSSLLDAAWHSSSKRMPTAHGIA